ncbi:sigma factor [Fictibacillus terranigra]|uniref:Sigma factor n=1 Tax=Fictibacillus terranigra TaxID=3058424 RepID=A0ABT8EBN0_9BACL|nr:sigma factor [Fictibacillus sp. CENA-BCM004]MDN4075295.1 sigma factor [Fictibacillus sp. CENA-BCM004]
MLKEGNRTIDNVKDFEIKVMKIQKGLRELVDAFRPFIIRVTSTVCRQYMDPCMDEFSKGFSAFNEAIDRYSVRRRLVTFADMVIRRRLIDYIGKEASKNRFTYLQPVE